MTRLTPTACCVALIAQIGIAFAQDRLPTVPGTLLLNSRDAAACLARENGAAPFDIVLDRAARDHPGLRTIAFTWSDIRAAEAFTGAREADVLDDPAEREARLAAWADAEPGPTAHT